MELEHVLTVLVYTTEEKQKEISIIGTLRRLMSLKKLKAIIISSAISIALFTVFPCCFSHVPVPNGTVP